MNVPVLFFTKLHDNAHLHIGKVTFEYLAGKKIKVLPHPPYSPNLAHCDFWLFPKLKEQLRNWIFSANENILFACDQIFARIPATEFANTWRFLKKIHIWMLKTPTSGAPVIV